MVQEVDGTCSGLECDVIHDRVDMQFFYSAVFVASKSNLVETTTWYGMGSITFPTKLPKVNVEWTAVLYAFELGTCKATEAHQFAGGFCVSDCGKRIGFCRFHD